MWLLVWSCLSLSLCYCFLFCPICSLFLFFLFFFFIWINYFLFHFISFGDLLPVAPYFVILVVELGFMVVIFITAYFQVLYYFRCNIRIFWCFHLSPPHLYIIAVIQFTFAYVVNTVLHCYCCLDCKLSFKVIYIISKKSCLLIYVVTIFHAHYSFVYIHISI